MDEARKILGPDIIIGGTANTIDDVIRLHKQGADYIGCGPFRFTTTKKNLSPILGLDGYKSIVLKMKESGINLPIVAIGGITVEDIPAVMGTKRERHRIERSNSRRPEPRGNDSKNN